jgi:hypothetical protein
MPIGRTRKAASDATPPIHSLPVRSRLTAPTRSRARSREVDERHVGHERKREGEKYRIEAGARPSGRVAPEQPELSQRAVDRPTSEDRQDDRRQTQRNEGKPEYARERRAPDDLCQRVDRAEFENLEPSRLQEMLDAPGIHPVVDDRNVGPRSDQQPPQREERGDGGQRGEVSSGLR